MNMNHKTGYDIQTKRDKKEFQTHRFTTQKFEIISIYGKQESENNNRLIL